MEQELFSWENWADIDAFVYQFYDCVLQTKIGDFEVGTKIPIITLNYATGELDLLNGEGNKMCETIHLELRIK